MSTQHSEPVRKSTRRIRAMQATRRTSRCQLMAIMVCSALMFWTATAKAETIKQPVDVNPRPSGILSDSFQSNGQVALLHASTRWLRITDNAAGGIRLNAPTGTVTALGTTRNYFYYLSRDKLAGTATVWRVNSRGLSRKIIGKISGVHRFSEPLVHTATGDIYLGDYQGSQRNQGIRLWRLDTTNGTLRSVAFVRGKCRGDCMDDVVITRTHIFFRINTPQQRSRETLFSFNLSSKRVDVVARGDYEGSFTDLVAGDGLVYYSSHVNRFGRNAHCALGRSDGSGAGTFLLTQADARYPVLPYLSNNLLFHCGFEVNIVNGDSAVFKRVKKRSGSARVDAFEIWRTRGTKATTRFLATAFDASQTDYTCLQTFRYTSAIEDPLIGDFESGPGRQLLVCWMSSVYLDGHLWVTNYELSPDRRNFKQIISTVNVSTGALRRVVEGNWNEDTVYRPVGDRVLLERRKLGKLRSTGSRVVQRTYFAARAAGSARQRIGSYREAGFIGSMGRQAFIAVPRNNGGNSVSLQSINLGTRAKTQRAVFRSQTTRSASRGLLLATHRNGVVYFCAETDQIPRDGISSLWRSNGQPGGTQQVVSSIGRTAGRETDPQACRDVRVDDRFVYYTHNDENSGLELWKADLDGANAQLFVDIVPGQQSSSPVEMNLVNGRLFVAASVSTDRRRVPIAVSPNGSWETLSDVAEVERVVATEDSVVLFQASVANGSEVVSELWQTDGTRGGTRRIVNGRVSIRRNENFRDIVTNVVTLNGDRYFFGTYTSDSSGATTRGLHRLRSGQQQPELVKEYDLLDSARLFFQLLVHRNSLYLGLISNVGTEGSSVVWRIDPATGEREVIAETAESGGLNRSDIGAIVSWNNQLYFYTTVMRYKNDALEQQWQIWRSSGEPRTSMRIHTERRATGPRFSSSLFLPTPDNLWFIMQSRQKGNELWQITR